MLRILEARLGGVSHYHLRGVLVFQDRVSLDPFAIQLQAHAPQHAGELAREAARPAADTGARRKSFRAHGDAAILRRTLRCFGGKCPLVFER